MNYHECAWSEKEAQKILSHWKVELDSHVDADYKNRCTSLTKYGYCILNMKKERLYIAIIIINIVKHLLSDKKIFLGN